jgi:hypothetical protein
MNQQEVANCHCIISHPSKPKFMVIKHSDRWSPPLVGIPVGGPMSTKAIFITDGIQQKYGLRTHALRHWVSLPKNHWVELELRSEVGDKRLQAVWVGSEEYEKFRRSSPGAFDPLEAWLRQMEAGGPGAQRPWERPGWFDNARNWMQHELDRLHIQATGSVEPFMAFRLASCVLRVPTAEGYVYLKASLRQEPLEAILTRALAQRWPDWIPAPLAINERHNWTLSRDYGASGRELAYADYPAIARGFGGLQVASMDSPEDWGALGCPVIRLIDLAAFMGEEDRIRGILAESGDDPLSEEEFRRLLARTAAWKSACQSLSEYPLPDALLHNDLWYPNLYVRDGGFWITDWSGAMVGHPFLAVLKLLRFRGLAPLGQATLPGEDECKRLEDAIAAEYLEPFAHFDSPQRLREALALARSLEGPWRLFRWSRAIEFEAHGAFAYQRIARMMRRVARELIGLEERPRVA